MIKGLSKSEWENNMYFIIFYYENSADESALPEKSTTWR